MLSKHSLTPVKTPRKLKVFRPVGTTPTKCKEGKVRRSVTNACRLLENYEYKKAFQYLYNHFPGAKKAVTNLIMKEIRKGIKNLLRDSNNALAKKCNMENILGFKWDSIMTDVLKHVPLLHAAIVATISSQTDTSLQSGKDKSLPPGTGLASSILLHLRSPFKLKFVQGLNSIELWRSGTQRKAFRHLNKLGFCTSLSTALRIISQLRVHADEDVLNMKHAIEEKLRSGAFELVTDEEVTDDEMSGEEYGTPSLSEESERETASSNAMEPSSSATISSLQDMPQTESDAETDVEIPSIETEEDLSSPGYTITWDNVGKMTKACHQSTNRQNKMMLWALSYCAENRISTTQITNEEVVKAVDIPIEKFLPMKPDLQEVRNRMEVIVMRIIQQNIPYFADTKVVTHIKHKYWRESSRKSKVINLGVCQENPSTAAGTIKILENLHQYVPTYEDKVHQVLCFGDGLSCERHNDAHMSRSNGETVIARLQGLQPQVQEFHKRMLLMQDIMDTYFHGSSAAEKGTLFHLKNVFGHRSVKKDVGETFNHAADFLKFVTHGYVLLATLQVCGMDNLQEQPKDPADITDVARRVVNLVWQNPNAHAILNADQDQSDYIYCKCKTDLGDEVPMIDCAGVHCPGNNRFHLDCLGMDEDDVPDEEFYCSVECQRRRVYRYCICHKDLGEFEPMVGCDNKACRLEWFHYKCVGIQDAPDGKWYCSEECRKDSSKKKSSKVTKVTKKEDGVHNYITSLTYMGLMDLVRQDAVRENDGEAMMSHWKLDLIHFHNHHHPKYVLLGHRLLAGISGWLPKRLAMDSTWNRTVSLAGGPGRNLPGDLVNEFLNKEFKESLKDAGGNLSEETIHRHSQLAGQMGKIISKAYSPDMDDRDFIKHVTVNMSKDLQLFVKMLHPQKFFVQVEGRSFKSYPDFIFSVAAKNPQKFKQKLVQLSKRLDKIRRCTTMALA